MAKEVVVLLIETSFDVLAAVAVVAPWAPPRPQTGHFGPRLGGGGGGVLRISSDSDDFLVLAIIFLGRLI